MAEAKITKVFKVFFELETQEQINFDRRRNDANELTAIPECCYDVRTKH